MNDYQAVYDAVVQSFASATQEFVLAGCEMQRPSVIYRPKIMIDGNMWCALYGENLQDGVAGFGESPAIAMYNFDLAWNARLPIKGT